MKARIYLSVALAITSLLYPTDQKTESEKNYPSSISCSGIITNYEKGLTQSQLNIHGCVWFEKVSNKRNDATWIQITSPEEFEGVSHILITNEDTTISPYGNVGDEVHFTTERSRLESDQKWISNIPNNPIRKTPLDPVAP